MHSRSFVAKAPLDDKSRTLHSSSNTIQKLQLTIVHQLDDELAEEGVLPSEPRAGEYLRIVLVEGFVHEARIGIRRHQHFDASLYFLVALAGESLHHDAHRPNHVVSHVRTTDAFACCTLEEVRIAVAPYKSASVLIDRVVDVHIAQVGHGEEAWHIGIVHKEMIAESVYLERIDGTELRMVVSGIFLQGCLYFVGQVQALLSRVAVLVYGIENLGCLAEGSHRKEVRWHEELKGSGIVRRAEGRYDDERLKKTLR